MPKLPMQLIQLNKLRAVWIIDPHTQIKQRVSLHTNTLLFN